MDSAEYNEIYRTEAQQYQVLIAREDHRDNIIRALCEIVDLDGRVVVDTGAGTGRLTKLLAPTAAAVYGFDVSPAMLAVAKQELSRTTDNNWLLAVADHRALPLPPQSADMIVSGWSLCYLALDQEDPWREPLQEVLGRMMHMLRPGGVIFILETQGTGFTSPHPPEFMLPYFAFLEEQGFQSRWIRTDYAFTSVEEAERLTRFFFGDELAEQVASVGSPIVPECTGIWWKRVETSA